MKTQAAKFWRSPNGQASRGQILIWVAVMITALLAVTALSLDTGRLWMARRALQNSVDAAALAGAWSLPDDTAGAVAVACDYGTVKNYVPEMSGVDCSSMADVVISDATYDSATVPNGKITVTSRRVMVPTLGSMFGWPSITVGAHATAVIGSLRTICTFPLFQTQDLLEASGAWAPDGEGNLVQYNVPVILKTNAGDSQKGNFLYLQVNGSSSKNDIKNAIASPGCSGGEVTDTATTSTGNAVGPLDQGMEQRALLYNDPTSPGYCPDMSPTVVDGIAVHPAGHPLAGEPLTPTNCYRVVQFPLLSGSSADYNGTTTGTIEGFLTFYISNWCGQNSNPPKGSGSDSQHCAAPAGTTLPELEWGELWGYYLKYEALTDLPITPYDGLGTKVVVLVE